MSVDDTFLTDMLAAEAEAMQIAERHISHFDPICSLPESVPFRMLSEYRELLKGGGHTRDEVSAMLRSDLSKATDALRAKTANLLHMGTVRQAVLLHVALMIGVEATEKVPGLWEALRARRYDAASEALLLSQWAIVVTEKGEGPRRVVELVRQMREGILTIEDTVRVH